MTGRSAKDSPASWLGGCGLDLVAINILGDSRLGGVNVWCQSLPGPNVGRSRYRYVKN